MLKFLSFTHWMPITKYRLAVLPIRLDTGRYEKHILAAEHKFCQKCNHSMIEENIHFLLCCPSSSVLRDRFLAILLMRALTPFCYSSKKLNPACKHCLLVLANNDILALHGSLLLAYHLYQFVLTFSA